MGYDLSGSSVTIKTNSLTLKMLKSIPTFGWDFLAGDTSDATNYSARNVIDNWFRPAEYHLENTNRSQMYLYEGMVLSKKSINGRRCGISTAS